MSTSSPAAPAAASWWVRFWRISASLWVRFWHQPIRAERLALVRILLAAALLADQLIQHLPYLADLFGPEGYAPAGLYDLFQLQRWRLSILIFGTDNLTVVYVVFGLWMAVTVGFLIGWQTRSMNVLLWFVTRCIHDRNPNMVYAADDVLQIAIFLLILTPCGAAFSLDAWLKRRKGLADQPVWVPPWSLRIIQIQMCLIYCTSGLAKLQGENFGNGPFEEWFQGTWWDGTSIHYFLNDLTMSRVAYAEFPVPFWLTMTMTYVSVFWEALFPLLVSNRLTRRVALIFGVLFHIGIMLSVDIGWFSLYMLSLYAVWIPDSWFDRLQFANHRDSEAQRNPK